MTWPTGPPPMPPPGWYDDPDTPWTWRYWDGAHWTDHRAPMWVPPVRDPRSFSVWFERSVAAVKLAVRRVGLLLVTVWLLLAVLGWWLVVASFDDDRGRELRRLLDIDQTTFGPTGSPRTAELTTAEAERAWELLQEIFWSALPWLIVLGLGVVVASAWSVALVARAVRCHVVDPTAATEQPVESRVAAASGALRRVPAVVASGIVVFAVFVGVWAVASFPVVLVVLVDGGGAAIVLTVVFVVLLVVVVSFWLWGRLTLAAVIAAAGGHGLGVRRSWGLSHDRFWFVVGRLIVTGLIAGVASGVANVVNGFGQFLGFGVYLAIVFLLQALAAAAAMIVTVCGHLVIIDQVDDPQRDAQPALTGSSSAEGSA